MHFVNTYRQERRKQHNQEFSWKKRISRQCTIKHGNTGETMQPRDKIERERERAKSCVPASLSYASPSAAVCCACNLHFMLRLHWLSASNSKRENCVKSCHRMFDACCQFKHFQLSSARTAI